MKPILRKLLSAALAVSMLAAPLSVSASYAYGHDLAASDAPVGAGTQLASGTFWSDSHSDFREENYIVYTPNPQVTPIVTYGETTRSRTSVPAIAKGLEAQGWRVVAGINGDYYGVSHGVPLGSTMVNGVLRNANHDKYYAVGFRADGTAIIGNPQLSIQTFVNGGSGFTVFAYNHVRHSDFGIMLYDHTFNDRNTTGTSEPGVEVILSCLGGAPTIGGTLALRVDEVLPSATDTFVPEGKYVLSANLKAGDAYTAPLLALQPGDDVTITITSGADSAWNEVQNLIGAPELLVEDGVVCTGLPTGTAPRTAIGQRADGSLLFYTIDGRQTGYSIGATLTALGMRLVELGCVTAVALDGGGSTTLVATRPNEMTARLANKPSETPRPVSNHVFLVTPNMPSGIPDHIYLAPAAMKALPGATIPLTGTLIDSNYIPMEGSVTFRTDRGSVVGNAVTLPDETGTVTVTGSSGIISASAQIEAVLPESFVVKRDGKAVTSLAIAPNSSVTLTAQATASHLPVYGGNECFTWSYEGDGVTLSDDGTLVAGSEAGVGTLRVSIGDKSVSIPVTVGSLPLKTLTGFETAFAPITDNSETPRLTLERTTNASIRFGKAVARLDYTLDGKSALTVPVSYDVGSGYDCVNLWAYGNGGSASLSLRTDAGTSVSAPLSFTGWKQLSLALPAGVKQITGITVNGPNAVHGIFLIDQLVLSHGGMTDTAAPEVSLTLDPATNALAGRAFDAIDGSSLPTLRLAYDGAPLTYNYDRTGALTAQLPANDGLAHYVTLTAGDGSGNLARASVYIPAAADLPPAFPDAAGHWSAGAIEYLRRTGVSNGSDGLYKPDDNITRQEFAAMIYRYLKPEQDFSAVQMPFVDNARIASWALEPARAMYSLGVIGGSRGSDGKLYYNPGANITRQEAVTMLGRLFEKGYALPELPYTDAASVPDWASDYVALLGSIGVFDDFVTDTFRPAVPLTRAEMAAMLLRMN